MSADTMADGSPVSPQLDARMLSELREWRARADTSDGARWSMRLTIDELDMLLRVADERDALKRELVDMPDDVPAPMPAVAEITHATMPAVIHPTEAPAAVASATVTFDRMTWR